MNYIEVCIETSGLPEILPEILLANLSELGYESFVEESTQLKAYISVANFSKSNTDNLLQPYFIEYSIREIAEKNWNAEWEENFKPVLIADKLFIRAAFHNKHEKAEIDLIIEPKMSFGTGHHETTAQMCELILKYPHKGKKVLDMGCGTGILAILAVKLGAASACAVDIDSWSYNNVQENIQLNEVSGVTALMGDVSVVPNAKYDIIYANINLNVIKNDVQHYAKLLKKNGLLFLSGFYETDMEQILIVCNNAKLALKEQSVQGQWTACVFA